MDLVANHVHEEHPYFALHPSWFNDGCVCGTDGCDWTARRLDCLFRPYMPDVNWRNTEASEQLIADAFSWFERAEPTRATALAKRVHDHKRHLDQLRLRGDFTARPGKALSTRAEAAKLALYALLLGPVAAYGLAHNFVPYRLTRMAARRAPDEPIQAISALAAGVFAFGGMYALFGWLAWHGSASLLGALLYVTTLPFAGFWFFRYRRRLGMYAQRIAARTLFLRRPQLYRGLVLEREQLLVELDAVRVAYQRVVVGGGGERGV